MVLKVLKVFLLIIVCSAVVFGADDLGDKYLSFNGFDIREDLDRNKVSYSIKVESDLEYDFVMKYYYEGEFLGKCEKNIFLEEGDVFKKVICDVEKRGSGEYVFDAVLSSNKSDYKDTSYEKVYIFNGTKTTMDFKLMDNKTNISINIEGDFEEAVVKQEIPKSVIEHLDEENKDDLIVSKREYEILDEDPLIAWNVERIPSQVDYTINKKVSEEEKRKFKAEVTQKKSFKFLKYLFFVLILGIVVIIFKPVISKKKK